VGTLSQFAPLQCPPPAFPVVAAEMPPRVPAPHPPAVGGAHSSHYHHVAGAVVAVAGNLAAGARLGSWGGLHRWKWKRPRGEVGVERFC